jgi:hypothetical protein
MMCRSILPRQIHSKPQSRRHVLATGCRCAVTGMALSTGLFGLPAYAHREKTIFTTIQYNPRSGMIEVMHRTYAHDVEHTLGNTLQARGGLESIEAQAWVALELGPAFTMWDGTTDALIPLELIGAEQEGEFFWIYQEAPAEKLPDALRIRHLMLRNQWPDMSNFVNVMFSSGVASALFAGNVETLTVSAGQVE